jgi:hypothetical protein
MGSREKGEDDVVISVSVTPGQQSLVGLNGSIILPFSS